MKEMGCEREEGGGGEEGVVKGREVKEQTSTLYTILYCLLCLMH